MEDATTRPAPVIDPVKYPVHEEFRRVGSPTQGGVYLVDRLYMETYAMHEELLKAKARIAELETQLLNELI